MSESEFEAVARELRKLTGRTVMVEVSPVPLRVEVDAEGDQVSDGGEGEAAQLHDLLITSVAQSGPGQISLRVSAGGKAIGEFHVFEDLVRAFEVRADSVRMCVGATEVAFWDQRAMDL